MAGTVDVMTASVQRAANPQVPQPYDPAAPARAFGAFAQHLLANPAQILKAQQEAAADWMKLWSSASARAAGGKAEPVIEPERGDRRFKDPAWSEEPAFDYIKQAYLLAAKRALALIENANGLDEATRTKVEFFTNQYLQALSPANFPLTNPEAVRRAIETGSVSLLSGFANLLEDAAQDAGLVTRRSSEDFELGERRIGRDIEGHP
jgi:polyhydroxyalkanoate synthase